MIGNDRDRKRVDGGEVKWVEVRNVQCCGGEERIH